MRRSTTSSGAGRRSRLQHGKDAVAVYSGSSMTSKHLTGKFARVGLGTRYIDYNGRFCMSSAAMAYARAFGVDRSPLPMTDIPLAGQHLRGRTWPSASRSPCSGSALPRPWRQPDRGRPPRDADHHR
ncbi:MAG: hypothetical protein U0893_11995 [Chloroflexota bacterium]